MGNSSSGDEKKKIVPLTPQSPVKNRGCTDIICCVLFALYMIGMVIVAIVGVKQGSPKRLLYPTDSDGKVCGADIADKPFLHFFDLTKCITKGAGMNPLTYVKESFSCPTKQVCVSKCSSKNAFGYSVGVEDMICVPGTTLKKDMTEDDKKKLIADGKCAPFYLESKAIYYRCVPSVLADTIDKLKLKDAAGAILNGTDVKNGEKALEYLISFNKFVTSVGNELKLTWKWLLLGFVLAMLVSVIYIVLARWITFPLVIISVIGTLTFLIYAIYYSFAKYKYLVESGTSKELVWRISMSVDDFAQSKTCWLVLGIVLVVVTLILFLICVFLYSNVRLACGLIAEASRAVCSMLSTLIFPIVPWLFQSVWFLWFVAVLLYLMSNGTERYEVSKNDTSNNYNLTKGDECNPATFNQSYPLTDATCYFAKYVQNTFLSRMQIYHLVGWLWGANYLIALTECSLAGAYASYYWAFNKPKDIPAFPIFAAMFRAFFYHTGSLALGAAIISVVQLIRITLEYIRRKLKEAEDNKVADCMLKCLGCCFWCLEKCLRFINKNAYIMIAITGKNFCVSAKKAVMILIKSIGTTMAINGITGFILFLGQLLITAGIGVGSFFWFSKYNANLPDKLEFSIVPIAICTVGAYIVAKMFFSVYDMGIDTLFLSYCYDDDVNDGSPEKPYFMTKSLQDIMDKHNKKVAVKKDDNELLAADA